MSKDPDTFPIPFVDRPDDGRGGKVVPMRLQRFLARAGVASRRASEDLMTAGRVTVNGLEARELGTKVDPLCDVVCVDGKRVELSEGAHTIMLHKPKDVITTMKGQSEKAIVADLIPLDRYPGLYPIGRLDSDTTGLLLFSTDGDLGNLLLHPSHHVRKTYHVTLNEPLAPKDAEALRRGVSLHDGPTQPAEVNLLDDDHRLVELVIHEGRYHQVKRMMEAVGYKVHALHRSAFGGLELGDLPYGQWRDLKPEEVDALKSSVRLNPTSENSDS